MFSAEFREKIAKDKYAQWAVDLTEEHLESLLWAVGEYGWRSETPIEVLKKHAPRDPVAYARAVLALEVLAEFSHGRPVNLDSYFERVHQVLAAVRMNRYSTNRDPHAAKISYSDTGIAARPKPWWKLW